MPAFPHELCAIRFGDHAEREATMYLRSEVERGLPRQRRFQADSLVTVPCTLLFKSRLNESAWRVWFGSDGGGFFDFTLPRTGQVVKARVIGGNLGTLKPRSPDWEWSERSIELEYIRQGFQVLPPGLHAVSASQILSVQRASTATFLDSAGVLQTAAVNVARFQGGQLLVEGAATNTTIRSQDLSTGWTGGTRTLAPEFWAGNVPFWQVAKAVSTSNESCFSTPFQVAAGSTWTMTLALLAGNVNTLSLGIGSSVLEGSSGIWGQEVDCSWEVLSGPGTLSTLGANFGGGRHVNDLSATQPTLIRVTRSIPAGSTVTNLRCYLYPGRSTSTTIGHSVKVTRVQTEAGAVATSYIPTTTAAVTRAADLIQVAA
jgi:hypothetical protein